MAAKNKVPPYPTGHKQSDIRLRRILPSLRLRECLKIEFRTKGVWSKMISESSKGFICEICGFTNSSPKYITLHVQGKKHRSALRHVDQLFHPEYTVPKGLTALEAQQERTAASAQRTQQQNMILLGGPQKLKAVAKKASAAEKTKYVSNAKLLESMPNPNYNVAGGTSRKKEVENGNIKEEKVVKPTPASTSVNYEDSKNVAKIVVLNNLKDEKHKEVNANGKTSDCESQTTTKLTRKAQKRPAFTDPVQKLPVKQQNISATQAQQKSADKNKFFTTKTPNDVEGIIGVEYVTMIYKVHNDPKPLYECCLCEVTTDGVGMQAHLLSYKHRYNYLEKHFPTCLNKYKNHIDNIQVMGTILDHVAKAIEAHHGRALPSECLSEEFDSSQRGVKRTVYSEYFGPSFTNVVDEEQIKEFYMQKNLYQPPKPNRKPTFETFNRAPVARRARNERRARAWALGRVHNRSPSPLREGDIWQAYRHLVDRSVTELNHIYRGYRKNPEKHPLYEEEWREFWKDRTEQMIREGLDYTNYEFQPEWVRYFSVRIEELYDEALEDIKITCRRRLILPMTNDKLEDKKYHVEVQHEKQAVEMTELSFEKIDNEPSVVNALRLLAALEEYLGSLGPKVVCLLSKALSVEKSNPRDINKIVLNIENSSILETAMEKLRGFLIAGLLERPKVRAFKNVISETEKILKIAYEIRQENLQTQMELPPKKSYLGFIGASNKGYFTPSALTESNECGSGMGVGCSDSAESFLPQIARKELASKIASALPAQGNINFNPEQLHQLIAEYSLINKGEKEKRILTALQNSDEKNRGGMFFGVEPSSDQMGAAFFNSRKNSSEPLCNSSISDFVSMLSRDYSSTDGNTNRGDSQMRQHLQNMQSSLRVQGSMATSTVSRGFNSDSVGGGRGKNNLADSIESGIYSSRNRFRGGERGSIGGFRQHTVMNFNRVTASSDCSGNMNSRPNDTAFGRSNNRYGGRTGERSEGFTSGGGSEAMGMRFELEGGLGIGKSNTGFSTSGKGNFPSGGSDSSRGVGGYSRSFMPVSGLSGFSSGYGVNGGSSPGGSFSAVSSFGSGIDWNYSNDISKLNRRDFSNSTNSSANFKNPSNKNTLRNNNYNSSCFPNQRNTRGNEHSQPINRNGFGSGNSFQSGSRGTSNWRNQ